MGCVACTAPTTPPPAPPSTKTQEQVVFETVLEGSLDSFDEESFRVGLASELEGVEPTDIAINVTSASVRVTAIITPKSHDVVATTVTRLNQFTPSSLE
eukprot:4876130-Prymnesium_polylepis.1